MGRKRFSSWGKFFLRRDDTRSGGGVSVILQPRGDGCTRKPPALRPYTHRCAPTPKPCPVSRRQQLRKWRFFSANLQSLTNFIQHGQTHPAILMPNGRTSGSDSACGCGFSPLWLKILLRLERLTLASKSTRNPGSSVVGGLHSEAMPRSRSPAFRPAV